MTAPHDPHDDYAHEDYAHGNDAPESRPDAQAETPVGPVGSESRGEAEAIRPEGTHRRGRLEELAERLSGPHRHTRRRTTPEQVIPRARMTVAQRLLVLDTWIRSKLPARDFSALVGISQHTLYAWKSRFDAEGPAGLQDRSRGPRRGSRLSDGTRRAIVLMKQAHPEWGQDRIHNMLLRTEGFAASPGAIGRVLEEEGYVVEDVPTKPHAPKVQRFERAKPNQLWQTDLFTFVLKRQNRRVYVVVFMDDHSRFITGYGLHASSSGALVREVLEAAIANYGAPEEILTDNGTQYHTWRGKSAFRKLLERRGIKQIVARPRHPQTLGKVERFWGTLWRECVERAIFVDIEDARRRLGLFIDHYNFQRTHAGIDGLVPADRYFAAAPQVLETLRARVAARAKELAQHGLPRKSFYLTGRVGDENISLHAEGERVVLTKGDGSREEVDLTAPGRREDDGAPHELPHSVSGEGRRADHPAGVDAADSPPGTSPLDEALPDLVEGLDESEEDE
jgi:transposase InsO family protein